MTSCLLGSRLNPLAGSFLRQGLSSKPFVPVRSFLTNRPQAWQKFASGGANVAKSSGLAQTASDFLAAVTFYTRPLYRLSPNSQQLFLCATPFFTFGALKSPFLSSAFLRAARCEEPRGDSPLRAAVSKTKFQVLTPKELTNQEVLSLFWDLVKPDVWWLLLTAVTAVVTAVVNLKIPGAIGELVNALNTLQSKTTEKIPLQQFLTDWSINAPAIKLVGLFLADGFLSFCYVSIVSIFGENFALRLRSRLFDSVIRQDIMFFDANKSGDILNRMTADVQDFKHSVKQTVSQGLKSGTQMVGGFLSLFSISQKLTFMIVVSLPVMYAIGSVYGRYLRKISVKAREADAKSAGIANECITNVRTVRAFAMEDTEYDTYTKSLKSAAHLHEYLGFHVGVFQAMTHLSFSGMFLSILYLGGSLVSSGDITNGQLMSYLFSTQSLQRAMANLVVLFGKVNRAVGAGGRVLYYIQLEPQQATKGGMILDHIKGTIQFRDVDFEYPTRPDQVVLNHFNLTIPAGKVVAVCGSSGGGKSTIAALIERFYEPTHGEVLLDGYPISQLDASWLRSQMGYINQEPTLFGTTIYENIRYGRPDATRGEIERAAKEANAHNFIQLFPNGYDTVVGERGVTLSGGQRQRIAIARAILKDPRILILDEATSALDSESETLVQEALERLMKGRTVFVIAHRLSTIKNADMICVISPKHKKIIEMGTHDQLMSMKGSYFSLYKQTQFES